jgi:hypothetical protein
MKLFSAVETGLGSTVRCHVAWDALYSKCRPGIGRSYRLRSQSAYCETIPIVPSHVSNNSGHAVTGDLVRKNVGEVSRVM